MWEFIHFGDFGQLKVLNLSKINNIRIKFQNLILIGCWKFGGKFYLCPHAQTFSLHKVKTPFRCPWDITSVLCVCAILSPNSCIILVQTENPVWHHSRIQVLTSCSTSGHFGGFPRIALFCLGIWRSVSSCCLHSLMALSMGGGPECLSAALLPCFLAY